MSRGVRAIIDLSALVHNFNRVKSLVGSSKIMAMVKSNAYGHGLLPCANAIANAGADALGAASLETAIILREHFQQEIVVMSGITQADELLLCSQQNLFPVIHHASQLSLLPTLKKPLTIWLKVDTGMHRLGFLPQELPEVLSTLAKLKSVHIRGLMTHFAEADHTDLSFTQQQMNCFQQVSKNFKGPKSLANSAAILKYPDTYADWVRPGIMLYGASPMSNQKGLDFGLKPVMTLQSKLIAIKEVAKGECIGYGCTWQCPQKTLIGVAAIGYGDGYPRHAPNGTPVLLKGKRVPLVGRVSMDMITLDISSEPQAKIGDVVTLWGKGLPVEEVATKAQTISYELFCQLTSRVAFDYI